ncbi:MAG: ester cyclase [Rhodopila sp.]|jgi:predicted ester cyclase
MDRRVLLTLAGGMLALPAAAQDAGGSRAVPDRFAATLSAHDIAAFAALFADDYVNHQISAAAPPAPAGKTPKQATVAFFAARLAGIPDLQVAVEAVVAASGMVAASFVYTGTHGGPLFGIAPTERRLRFTSCDIFRLENERIVEHWGMGDIAGVLRQIRA